MNEFEIFTEVSDVLDPVARTALLDRLCGDDRALRDRVEELLREEPNLDGFLEQSAADIVRPDLRDRPSGSWDVPGTVINGTYTLGEPIGEGGMGTVYEASEGPPHSRQVALKIVRPGLDATGVVDRFQSELQALTRMDHPNIARAYAGGTTESGRPYFVMELIRGGVHITDYCDSYRLGLEARLRLFLDVCRAVQHAHQKSIVHLDITPRNVLVAPNDGAPVVKVIDFGIARATDQNRADQAPTAPGPVIGTLTYMSPEQASASEDVDTRSDVYSLGVLLYELLTGTTPLKREQLTDQKPDEIRRLIREEVAPRPSTRVTETETAAAATVAVNRGRRSVRSLARALATDLDWVALKALEKDLCRRYETPTDLARDVERYLHGEAVQARLQARPPSRAYRLNRFVRRNRVVVLTAVVVTASLVAGTSVATWQMIAAQAAAKAEKQAKGSALDRAAETEAVIEFVERDVFAAMKPKGRGGLGHEVTLPRAVQNALQYVRQKYPNQPLIEARLRRSLGEAFHWLGEYRTAAEQHEAARAIYAEHLGPDHPDTLRNDLDLASSYGEDGRPEDALKISQLILEPLRTNFGPDNPFTLKCMHVTAASHFAMGQYAEALKLYREILTLRQATLGPDHPDTLLCKLGLAGCYLQQSCYEDALAVYQEILEPMKAIFGPDHPDTLICLNNMAPCHVALWPREAGDIFEVTLALRENHLGPDHPETLVSMYNLANYDLMHGWRHSALRLCEKALPRMKIRLGPDHPDTLRTMAVAATALVKLGRGAEAVPLIDDCVRRASGKVADPTFVPELMARRLKMFQQSMDAQGCQRTAELWEELNRPDMASLYDTACAHAVTAAVSRTANKPPVDPKLADAEAERAVAWLKKAVAAGFKDVEHLKLDPDLDALRDRTDFQKLLKDLEAAPKNDGR